MQQRSLNAEPCKAAGRTTRIGRASCPVCRSPSARTFLRVEGKQYWCCNTCDARFLDARFHPSHEEEYAHYLLPENEVEDPRYRGFLARLAEPLLARLSPESTGLDYGCGPGPALPAMLREAGHGMALYDPFFFPDPAPLVLRYDFITCTEVAEHFRRPGEEFDRLGKMLRPGGWLVIMTCFQTDDDRFAGWHYRRDPTHVVFYREATLRFVAASRGWRCEVPTKDVVLMRGPCDSVGWRAFYRLDSNCYLYSRFTSQAVPDGALEHHKAPQLPRLATASNRQSRVRSRLQAPPFSQ